MISRRRDKAFGLRSPYNNKRRVHTYVYIILVARRGIDTRGVDIIILLRREPARATVV